MTDIDRLTRALEQWKCPSCGGTGNYLNKSFATGAYQESTVPCSKCGGLGLHPIAAEALAHPPQANSANEDALEAYRAAIRWVAADSWDGCPDCIKILQMARSLDEFDWTPDQHAKALKRLYDRSGGEPFAQANNAPPASSGVEDRWRATLAPECCTEFKTEPDCHCPHEHWHIGAAAGSCLDVHLEEDGSAHIAFYSGDDERELLVTGVLNIEEARAVAFGWLGGFITPTIPARHRTAELTAEVERAWEAYRIAHDQATENGSRLKELRAALKQLSDEAELADPLGYGWKEARENARAALGQPS